MNEIEKSIKAFEISLENPLAEHMRTPAYAVIEPAFLTALAALREQAEREKGCEYCNGPSNAYVAIQKYPTRGMIGTTPNFCPMCGRRLEVKQDG